MRATSIVVAAAACAGLATAYQDAYPIGILNNEVACPGVAIPTDGIYAAVSSVEFTFLFDFYLPYKQSYHHHRHHHHHPIDAYVQAQITPDSCGGIVNVTDLTTGTSLNYVPVVSEFPNCDSAACAGYTVRLSSAAWTALGLNSQTSGFSASWTVAPKPAVGTWSSIGCWSDNLDTRSLTGIQFANVGAVSDSNCIAYCQTNGYVLAGTEYGGQCFCGNSFNAGTTRLPASSCYMPCEGDSTQICGGPNALTVSQEST